jgi:hypothetical protein
MKFSYGYMCRVSDSKPAQKGSRCLNAVLCGGSIALLQCIETSKKKNASDGKKYHVAIYDSCNIGNAEDSSWEDSAGKGGQDGYVLDIEGVTEDASASPSVHLAVNGSSQSMSILYHSADNCMKWMKISTRAELLFERSFDMKTGELFPNAVIGLSGSLWVFSMVSGKSTVEVWQSRYGVRTLDIDGEAAVIRIPGYHSDEVPVSGSKGNRGSSQASVEVVVALRRVGAEGVGILACSTHVSPPDEPTYSLSQFTLQASQCAYVLDTLHDLEGRVSSGGKDLWSLGSLIGSLKRNRKAESDDSKKGVRGGASAAAKRARKGSTQSGVLDLLTAESQTALKSMLESSSVVRRDAIEDAAMVQLSIHSQYDACPYLRPSYVCYVQQEFLRVAEQMASLATPSSGCSEWGADDWEVFGDLLSNGYVAMSMYPRLFGAVLHANR